MKYTTIFSGLKLEEYSGDELEEFGKRLCRQLFLHIGMIKYVKSELKSFDFKSRELSELADEASVVVLGIDTIAGVQEYTERLRLLIGLVGELEHSSGKNSVKRDLQNSFMNEMRNLISTASNTVTYWNID